jgi:hypothetical protein
MTSYPPGGNPPPDQPQDPGYGGSGPGYGGQDPAYGGPQGPGYGPGYGAPQGPPGYDPSGGGYAPPPGPGYDPGYGHPPGQQAPGQQAPWDYRQQQTQQPPPYYQGGPGPGYALEPSHGHSQAYPVQVSIEYPGQSSRVLAALSIPFFLLRLIMLIPALFVLYFVGIAAVVVAWIAFWAVLFTGRYPPAFHTFVAGYVRWSTRTSSFLYGLTDKYPPFSLEP